MKYNIAAIAGQTIGQILASFLKSKDSLTGCIRRFYRSLCAVGFCRACKPRHMKANATNDKYVCNKPFLHCGEDSQKRATGQPIRV
jgi:hypothetical protein